MSTTPIVPAPPPEGAPSTLANGLPSAPSLNNMFLQLLVAQLQHQDPTAPVDPSQFIGQLAQFSELSEVTSIYQLLQQAFPPSQGTATRGTSPAGGSSAKPAANPVQPTLMSSPATVGSAVFPAAVPSPNFVSPTVSTLTSKIQGAF